MNCPENETEPTDRLAQEGLKMLGWIILLLGVLTLAIGLPLTMLGF